MTLLEQILQESKETRTEKRNKNYFEISKQQYRDFNLDSWNKGIGYVMLPEHFPIFNEQIEGLEKGLYLIAGDSNSGKSALLLELIYRYAENPANKLFGVYVSLDDSKDKIIPRFLASNAELSTGEKGVPIDLFSKPKRYINKLRMAGEDTEQEKLYYSYLYEDILSEGILRRELLEKEPVSWEEYPDSVRGKAYSWLKSTEKYFYILDGTDIETGEQLFEKLKDIQQYIRDWHGDPEYNIIVGIDSFFDITWEEKFSTDKQYNEYTSKQLKKQSVEELKCPILGSIHLRKGDPKKRPVIADVKESGRWIYDANMVFLINNDVSRNGEGAGIYYTTDTSDFKQPVIEIRWAKNKQSSFKGYTFCYFETNFSRVWECGREKTKEYTALLLSSR